MLREMEKPREQGNISIVEKSNLFQWERGIGRVNGSINKGRIRIRNNQSDELIGNSIVEQNICNKETGRRIEENNGLSAVEYIAKIPTFYNERSEQGTGNVEIKRLGMPDGHQISVQPCSSNGRTGEIPCIHTQRNSLYTSGNAIWDLDSTEDVRKDNTDSNRQGEEQEPSSYNKLRRRHSVSNEGSGITREGNIMNSRGVQEIWMGNQREEEQAETGVTVCIPGMDVQFNNNEDLIDQREKEGIESTSLKNRQSQQWKKEYKRSKAWQQSSESIGMDKRDDSIKEMPDRTILVGDIIGEQQTKDDRQETERDNNLDRCINNWMGSECDQEQHKDQEDIRIMGSEHGEFQSERNTSNMQINTIPQGIYGVGFFN
ncbi:MAG: hypothetical protein EZS28_006214 [Streblomastix strix]|uniref:Uncharacterized protein n=1 Tax=Streblomastix strix TaxID=222440 RepID=A0A5J4WTY4_9EUKA|nr:MAG: hypothetical protein EZS28_006214 [Streblomastix strix]